MRMRYASVSDIDVIRMIRNNDEGAMEYLLKKYLGMVRKEARRFYLIGADEEDLIQEGMIGLFKAICDFDLEKKTDFALFSNLCIVRQMLTAVTASNRQKHTPLNSYISIYAPLEESESNMTVQETLGEEISNPEQLLIRQERIEELWTQIDKRLSTLERKVLELYLEGDSYEVIADKLGKSKKAIDNAIQRIRKKWMQER